MSTNFGAAPELGSGSSWIMYRGNDGKQYMSQEEMYRHNPGQKQQEIGQSDDPWGQSGGRGAAVSQLQGSMSDPSQWWQDKLKAMMTGGFNSSDPSYQWRFQQGQQAVERSLAARQLLNSGNAATELTQYGQGMASTEFQSQFSRLLSGMEGVESTYSAQMNRLMKLAGVDDPVAVGALQVQRGHLANEESRQQFGFQTAANKSLGVGQGMQNYNAPIDPFMNDPYFADSTGNPNYFSDSTGMF